MQKYGFIKLKPAFDVVIQIPFPLNFIGIFMLIHELLFEKIYLSILFGFVSVPYLSFNFYPFILFNAQIYGNRFKLFSNFNTKKTDSFLVD